MTRAVAVIPARGGSKRLPRKNILPFAGKPLLAWSVEAALDSGVFEDVVVSTEDEEIAEFARRYGASVPFMRDAVYDDVSNVSDVTVHALQRLGAMGRSYGVAAMLQATCPLRNAADIRAGLEAFLLSGADFQISCYATGWMSPWWAFERRDDGTPAFLHPERIGQRTQDQPKTYNVSGALLIGRAERLLETGTYYGPGVRFEPIPWTSAVDIDDEDDLRFALAVKGMRDAA